MPRRDAPAWVALGAALALLSQACAPDPHPGPAATPSAAIATPAPQRPAAPAASPSPGPTPTAAPASGPTFILLRASEIAVGARLNVQGQGFGPGEQASVAIEDRQGAREAALEPVTISKDGNLDEVSLVVPDGIGGGDHVLHVAGLASGRSATAAFHVRDVTPMIVLDTYSAKADHTFGFTGSGFAPSEVVDVRLGGLGGSPLASVPSDAQGNVAATAVPLPFVQGGDYRLYFIGQRSRTPVSVGFNVQGLTPWVVLDTYAAAPYSAMGFSGQDFAPGERVDVYLGQRTGRPLAQLVADSTGAFSAQDAFNLPELAHGDQQLVFVGRQSGAEIVARFVVLPFSPGLELTNYAGRPGTPIAFTGSGWARNETLRASVGEGHQPVATFQTDATGAFAAAGEFRLPIGTNAGGVPLTVRGDASGAEVTLWYQALELKPSAELTAYQGPPGTVVAFTGRSFAGGERVVVHLGDRGGPELASGVASDDGTIENVGSYPIDGSWAEDIHFVLVGADSHAEAATDFKIATPDSPAENV